MKRKCVTHCLQLSKQFTQNNRSNFMCIVIIKSNMASVVSDYHIIGEHEENGIYHSSDFPAEQIAKVADFKFKEEDILIATYPKAGKLKVQHCGLKANLRHIVLLWTLCLIHFPLK